MKTRTAGLAAMGILGFAYSCATIVPIGADARCGNSVVEAGEDCDRFAQLGMACRAPASEGECRFDCSSNGEPAAELCGAAYGCGNDAICRAPRGQLELGDELDDDASQLVARDFDADGIPDVMAETSGGPVLVFMGEAFHPDQSNDLTALPAHAPFSVVEVTGDDLPDVAFIDHTGVGVARGASGRELAGTAYASFPIPKVEALVVWTMDAVRGQAGDEPLVFIQLGNRFSGLTMVLLVDASTLTKTQYRLASVGAFPPLLVDGVQSLSNVAAGDLDPATPCDEYVLAFREQDRVLAGTACTQAGAKNGEVFKADATSFPPTPIAPIEIDLSACAPAPGVAFQVDKAFVVDVDHANGPDIVITPEAVTDGVAACVVYGPLQFEKPPPGPVPAAPATGTAFPAITVLPGERVLALDDINGDGAPDLVTSAGIFTSTSGACPAESPVRLGDASQRYCDVTPHSADLQIGPYTSAAVGDLNANDGRDVVVADGETDQVVVQIGEGDGTFSSFPVSAEGFPDGLAVGDFDGDGVDDVAFANRACPTSGCTDGDTSGADTLSVSFGRAAGGPEPAINVGKLGHIEQTVVGRFKEPFSTLDGTTDLGVLFTDVSDPSAFSFATLFGSTERHLQAPFVIYERSLIPNNERLFAPLGLVGGEFTELEGDNYVPSSAAAHEDLAVIAFAVGPDGPQVSDPRDDLRMWLVPAEGEAELESSHVWESEKLVDLPDEWDPLSSYLVAANLDDDPADEIVYIGGRGFVIGDLAETTDAVDGTLHPAFVPRAQHTAAFFESSVRAGGSPSSGAPSKFGVGVPIPLVVDDIDRDGARDLVTLGWQDGVQTLVVYWNEGGEFSDASSTSVALENPTSAILAFNFDADDQLEIVLADSRGASFVDVTAASPRILSAPSPMPGIQSGSPPGTALAAADFDRDGVIDLVLGHPGSISIYRSLPVIE